MTQLPPDAGTVCTALELDAGYLADLFRQAAASELHRLADLITEDTLAARSPHVDHATHLLLIVSAFEQEWEQQESESDGAVGRNGGDSLTPPPPPSRTEIVPESRRVGT